ncbi:MarR family winged helix-turn-helix transcriptional regulator [Halioxenophilus sp. WMMB6]|uniref:MarR family winged helix-turn-helix transcriptional regulator n=1 Tax=Halioxenophilus sp. WMMB6 TaxID=3073815 RepID=UPI00295EDCE8|nr:MarR family winged helix-turn-helix transcriptional regulator [Halioxenophilus sp. WMMB6]
MAKKKIQLGQLLLRGFHWMDDGLQRGLQSKGWPEITHAQSMLIIAVGEGINRPSDIAKYLGVSRQAVHQSLNEIVKMGILEMLPDPTDGRAKVVSVSEDAQPMVMDARKVNSNLEKSLAKQLGVDRVKMLREILEEDWGRVD